METQCLKIRLKENKKEKVREWCKRFSSHPDLHDVLKEETVIVEDLFIDEQEDADYLLFYLKAESLQKANEFLNNVQHPINDLSNEFMQECWDFNDIKELDLVLSVNTLEN